MAKLAWRVARDALIVYLLLLVGMWALQRRLIFPAPSVATEPELHGGSIVRIPMAGGSEAVALHIPAPAGARTIVHFHGNAEQLADVTDLAVSLRTAGFGVYAIEYPGYGLARSMPVSETNIIATADAALTHLHSVLGVPPERIVLMGQSLGTGVAAQMAARGHGARLILLSPYTSLVDVARTRMPFLPVSWLMRDRFDTAAIARSITLPTLIVHGSEDEVIPVVMGRRLAEMLPHATLAVMQGRHHNDLFEDGGDVLLRIVTFARGYETPPG